MKWMFVRVWTRKLALAVGMRAEHVIINEQIVVAETLCGLRVILDGVRIVAEFSLRKDNTVARRKLGCGHWV